MWRLPRGDAAAPAAQAVPARRRCDASRSGTLMLRGAAPRRPGWPGAPGSGRLRAPVPRTLTGHEGGGAGARVVGAARAWMVQLRQPKMYTVWRGWVSRSRMSWLSTWCSTTHLRSASHAVRGGARARGAAAPGAAAPGAALRASAARRALAVRHRASARALRGSKGAAAPASEAGSQPQA